MCWPLKGKQSYNQDDHARHIFIQRSMMLGLQRGTVRVIPYTPLWASLFQEERSRLTAALGSLALDVQHIGSTSVPGLAAKPILDVGIAIAAEADVAACVP